MSLGTGIAIAGIWIAVGLWSIGSSSFSLVIIGAACIATAMVIKNRE